MRVPTLVNAPPTYSVFLSVETASARTWPLNAPGTKPLTSFPVVMSYANRFRRAVWLVPGAAPAGRAAVKSPPANTMLPIITWVQTTPLIWTVGSASALTWAVVLARTAGAAAGRGARCADQGEQQHEAG